MRSYNFGEDLYQWANRAKEDRFWINCKLINPPNYMEEYFKKDSDEKKVLKVLEVFPHYSKDSCTVKVVTNSGRQFTFDENELEFS